MKRYLNTAMSTDAETPPAGSNPVEGPDPLPGEHVWSFRGYSLRPSEFTSALTAYYQAEIERSNVWRQRLDTTTNWAVLTTGAALAFAFGSSTNHHGVIILATCLVTFFAWIEARRYRYYELWSYRARLMETDFFAAMLVPPFRPHPEWAESLAESLLEPQFPISMWEAFGRRFRRNYQWLFVVMAIAWVAEIYLQPPTVQVWDEFVARAAVGGIRGEVVLAIGLVYNGVLFAIGLATARLTHASGEVLPKFGASAERSTGGRPRAFQARRRQQVLAFLVTGRPKDVAARIMKDMRRGVTALHGEGMYTQTDRDVLFVALTVTETAMLKTLVEVEDPNAFVVMVPVNEILGRGFKPLKVQ